MRAISGGIGERILILCEGGKTEPNYFYAIQRDTRNTALEIPPTKKNTPKELVDEAVELMKKAKREKNAYKEIWVVFDKDTHPNHHEAFTTARDNKINIAFSSSCFEFWLLLHFEYTTAPFKDCDNLISRLKQHIPNYKKNGEYYTAFLRPKTIEAIKNGKRIIAHCNQTGHGNIWEHNPYTDVGILVEKLLSL